MQVGKKSNCYQLNSNRIQHDHVKLWGRSAVQKKNPTKTQSVKIKMGLQNTFKITYLEQEMGKLSP
jgi:hypothetical protein